MKQFVVLVTSAVLLVCFISILVSWGNIQSQNPIEDFNKIKLLKVYQSMEEYEETSNEPKKQTKSLITDEEGYIYFRDPATGNVINQLKKKNILGKITFTSEEKTQLRKGELVSKELFEYRILERGAILVIKKYKALYETESSISRGFDNGRILYNHFGKQILELLPGEQNEIHIDPGNNFFVAYTDGELAYVPHLFFYDINGNLLSKYKIDANFLDVEYSESGKFLKVIDGDKTSVFIFTLMGQLSFEYNYKNLLKTHSSRLFKFYLSENGSLILLSMLDSMVLMNKDGNIDWQLPARRILNCRINEERECILVYTTTKYGKVRDVPKKIIILALKDGQSIDKIDGVELNKINSDSFIIEKGGQIYEYEIN